MPERTQTIAVITVALVALVVIAIGLGRDPATEATPDERVEALAASIKCPFCNGESLADSPSSVAADYRGLIAERVAAGYTDEEIRREFADNFGEAFILDTSTGGWSIGLWVAPVAVLIVGAVAIVTMRRSAMRSEREPM